MTLKDPLTNEATLTTIGIGVLASIAAAVLHEAGGHGGMCLAIGGHPLLLTSLFLECDRQRPVVAVAGPVVSVIGGIVALSIARRLRHRASARHLQLFCWLLGAYSLFLGAGYMVFSGISGTGDWAFLFGVGAPAPWERGLLTCVGVAAVVGSRALVLWGRPDLVSDPIVPATGGRLLWIYIVAAAVSVLAALFDPAGLDAVLKLPPAAPLAGLGLLWVGRTLRRSAPADWARTLDVPRHRGWLVAGALAAIAFIGILGPGIRLGSALELARNSRPGDFGSP